MPNPSSAGLPNPASYTDLADGTVKPDGIDLVPAATGEQIGLSCRVYRRRDGRVSPIPDPDDLREALREAAERAEVKR